MPFEMGWPFGVEQKQIGCGGYRGFATVLKLFFSKYESNT